MESFKNDHIQAYVYQQAKGGNSDSGDVYFLHAEDDYFICAIADGLGSGIVARQSAEVMPRILEEHHAETIEELLSRINEHMVQKRGAAVAIVKVDYTKHTIQHSCVGNVRLYIRQADGKMLYPLPVMGYLSGRPQKMKTQEYTYQNGDLFFMHSDGVELRSPKSYLSQSDDPLVVSEMVRETVKPGDDATFIAGTLLL